MESVHQENRWEVLGEKVELLQISLRLMLGLGGPGQGQEQHGCVGALLPAAKCKVYRREIEAGDLTLDICLYLRSDCRTGPGPGGPGGPPRACPCTAQSLLVFSGSPAEP